VDPLANLPTAVNLVAVTAFLAARERLSEEWRGAEGEGTPG